MVPITICDMASPIRGNLGLNQTGRDDFFEPVWRKLSSPGIENFVFGCRPLQTALCGMEGLQFVFCQIPANLVLWHFSFLAVKVCNGNADGLNVT